MNEESIGILSHEHSVIPQENLMIFKKGKYCLKFLRFILGVSWNSQFILQSIADFFLRNGHQIYNNTNRVGNKFQNLRNHKQNT